MNNLLRYLTNIDFSNSIDFSDNDLEERAILIGVVAELILSKKLHNKNEDLKDFINTNFRIELGDYLYKSRTLLLSRIIRLIESSDKEFLRKTTSNISSYLQDLKITAKNTTYENHPNKKSKRKSTMDSIENWRKVISGENV